MFIQKCPQAWAVIAALCGIAACDDPATPQLTKCTNLQTRKLWNEAIQACEAAVAESATSKSGRLAATMLPELRGQADSERRAAATNAAKAAPGAKKEEEPQIAQDAPRYDATSAELKTMLGIVGEVRSLHRRCAAPRVRDVTEACIATLRESHAALERLEAKMQTIPKSAAGRFDLGVAISLSENCCNCSESDARLCTKVRDDLATAEAALRTAKPHPE